MSAYGFQSALDSLTGGRTADVVGNRFLHTGADIAHVVLDYGGEARLGVLAVGCDTGSGGDPVEQRPAQKTG